MFSFLRRFIFQGLNSTIVRSIGLSLAIAIGLLLIPAESSQSAQPPLRVVTRIIPPFVIQDGVDLSGFSIDLWRNIAAEIGTEFKFSAVATLPELLQAISAKKADLGIAAISITSERDRQFDFSYPTLNAGLQMMVRDLKQSPAAPNLFGVLFSAAMLQILGFALLMIAVIAHLVWAIERTHREAIISKNYFPGIFEAAWWASATLATQADQMPKGALTRIVAVLWMFTAVVFVALFTATFTTNLTVQQLQGDIKGIGDLGDRTVATTTGSTSAAFLRDRKLKVMEFPAIEQAYDALLNQQVDAIVADAPVLMYYAAHNGKGKVQLVGTVLKDENYGIVMPNNSPNRKRINTALLKLRENGTYQTLYEQYFKSAS